MGNLAHDKPTLMTTALASLTFRDICQRMLFTELAITHILFYHQKLPGARLLPILKGSPRIVSYIQSISISGGSPFQLDNRPSRLAEDSDLAEVLHLLSLQGRVNSISLSDLRWSKLPSTTRNTISVLCRSRSIQKASVRRSPVQLAGLFGQSLKHLTISLSISSLLSLPANSSLELSTPASQLQSLHIVLWRFPDQSKLPEIVDFLLDPTTAIGVQVLRDLRIIQAPAPLSGARHGPYDPSLQRLLSACGSSLETFTFTAPANPVQSVILDLSPLTNLRKIRIFWSDAKMIQGFTQIIETVRLETPLATVCFRHAAVRLCPLEPMAEYWVNLDKACARLHKHGRLAQVAFDFPELVDRVASKVEAAHAAIEKALPRVRAAGILYLDSPCGSWKRST
ncbi:hypothetical protein FA15DRAFT_665100 [Coprinopsis marcescibilis]|uniref:F-box domain-containing protein n=1 Tax=Coprinopsis marcescibilis TaxID=230819 RepID=A0A5C3L824_COPMA|nr:hypothetical protein FA15DRAFT_665100 [Coprinopsis marcescibilis]